MEGRIRIPMDTLACPRCGRRERVIQGATAWCPCRSRTALGNRERREPNRMVRVSA